VIDGTEVAIGLGKVQGSVREVAALGAPSTENKGLSPTQFRVADPANQK